MKIGEFINVKFIELFQAKAFSIISHVLRFVSRNWEFFHIIITIYEHLWAIRYVNLLRYFVQK